MFFEYEPVGDARFDTLVKTMPEIHDKISKFIRKYGREPEWIRLPYSEFRHLTYGTMTICGYLAGLTFSENIEVGISI